MKKMLFVLFVSICLTVPGYAMTLAWDDYVDSSADGLRVYHSVNESTWSVLVDNIPTSFSATEVPDNPVDNVRVYYLLRAFNDSGESIDSNTVSYFWATGGGGTVGPAAVVGISLIDCSIFDSISDDGSLEWDLCKGRYQP